MKDILFSPYLEKHKAPLGALCINEECKLTLFINKEFNIYNLELVIREDDNRLIEHIKCNYTSTNDKYNIYTVTFTLHDYYIYFYYFQFEDCYGKHYIGSDENMNGYLTNNLDRVFQINVYESFPSNLDWYKGKIMYQIFVDRFCKGGKNPVKENVIMHEDWNEGPNYLPVNGKILNNDFFGGDLDGIISKLDYLKELNVGVIYLNPIFLSPSNHKYDTSDYMMIDPMFGTEETFKKLCKEAKKRKIRIILDGVFNHTGSNSIYFNKDNEFDSVGAYQSKKSPYYDWYQFINYPNKYESWWGIDTLPSVNQRNDKFMDFITSDDGVISKWLKLGASGFRLDVVDELNTRFVDKIHKQVKKISKDNILIGEVWEDASNKIAYDKRRTYFNGSQLDSVMNYPLKDGIVDFINKGYTNNLRFAINSMINNLPNHVLNSMMNLLSTHDTARIMSVFSKVNFYSLSKDEQAKYNMSQETYYKSRSKLKMASALLYTLPGVPCIFYGDECGVQGFKDPFCRKTMPWGNFDEEINNWYKKLGNIRKKAVYVDGKYEELFTYSDKVFAFSRAKDNKKIMTIVNNSGFEYNYNLKSGYDLLHDESIKNIVTIFPHTARIIEVYED